MLSQQKISAQGTAAFNPSTASASLAKRQRAEDLADHERNAERGNQHGPNRKGGSENGVVDMIAKSSAGNDT